MYPPGWSEDTPTTQPESRHRKVKDHKAMPVQLMRFLVGQRLALLVRGKNACRLRVSLPVQQELAPPLA